MHISNVLILIYSCNLLFLLIKLAKIKNLLEIKEPDKLIIGPSMMHPFKVNNVNRFSIIIKYKKENNLKETLRGLIEHYKGNSKIKIDYDFNPINL